MPSTGRAAETKAFENVRSTPFTRIHGCPYWSDYKILKQEATTIASKVEDITYNWSRDAGTGDEYGLLAEILGVDEFYHQTGISTYVKETEPGTYDSTINNTTPTHTQKRKEEEWERVQYPVITSRQIWATTYLTGLHVDVVPIVSYVLLQLDTRIVTHQTDRYLSRYRTSQYVRLTSY